MAIIEEFLRKKGYSIPSQENYDAIQEWLCWYRGYLSAFHDFTVYNGLKRVHEKRYSLGMAKTICEDFSSLLVNEHMQITCEKLGDRLNEILNDNEFYTRLNRLSETVMALGCGAMVEYRGADGKPVIDYIRGDMVYPLAWDGDRITECAFASRSVLPDAAGGKIGYYVQAHVREEGGWRIHNAILSEEGEEIALPEGMLDESPISPIPLFQILRPNNVNTTDFDSPLGMSVFGNAIDLLKACDIVFDSYVNEFVLGKKRLMVPLSLAKMMTQQDGTMKPIFDKNDTLFYVYQSDDEKEGLKELDMRLRTGEHEQAMQRVIDMLSKKCGLGIGRYRFDQGGVKTATEVISQKSDLYQSIEKHRKTYGTAVRGCVQALCWLENGTEGADVCINFDDSIIEDTNATIDRNIKLLDSGLISRKDAIMNIYHLCEQDAVSKLEEIRKESDISQENVNDYLDNAE